MSIVLTLIFVQSFKQFRNCESYVSEEEIDNKITVIFATDVVGYKKNCLGNQPNQISMFTTGQRAIMLMAPIQETEYFKMLLTSIKMV